MALLRELAEVGRGQNQSAAIATLAECPPIEPDSAFFWRAFNECSADRDTSMGVGPIRFSTMIAYADELSLRGYERWQLFSVIRAVDNRFREIASQKQDEAAKRREASRTR